MSADPKSVVGRLRFFNSRPIEISFCLEPWGDAVPMHPGTSLDVVLRGAMQEFAEITYEETRIVFYAGSDSEAAVFRDGVWLGGSRDTT
jgi:hypothetical protein